MDELNAMKGRTKFDFNQINGIVISNKLNLHFDWMLPCGFQIELECGEKSDWRELECI